MLRQQLPWPLNEWLCHGHDPTQNVGLTGFNQGTNTFAGNIQNNETSATALTKAGMDLWILTGAGHNYSGTLAINQGTLRVVNANGLGVTQHSRWLVSST